MKPRLQEGFYGVNEAYHPLTIFIEINDLHKI